jgi:hypothetical protein
MISRKYVFCHKTFIYETRSLQYHKYHLSGKTATTKRRTQPNNTVDTEKNRHEVK